jgi:F0F1-type ATP synthase assembly protein I
MPDDDQDKVAKGYGQGYEYFSLAMAFVVAILGFGALGWLVDGWLHTRPLIAIVGAFVGGFAGFMNIYYRVVRDTSSGAKQKPK